MSDYNAAIGATGVGIIGSATWASIVLFGRPISLGPQGMAFAAIVVVLPFGFALYSLSNPEGSSTEDTAAEFDHEVKARTEQWSDEAAIRPAFPSNEPEQAHSSPPSRSSDHNVSDNRGQRERQNEHQVDLSTLDFNWDVELDVSFDDIGGMEDLKNKLRTDVVKPLECPERARELGVSAPNILLHGPPGTGKSYTARALATEIGLPFVSLSGADVQSKWINESANQVNNLFKEARMVANREGGAVIFIDELDSVLRARTGSESAHEEDTKVVNEFLNALEDTKEHNIVFIGATNRLDSLDEAGVRSGRIDRKIHIGKPDVAARNKILHAQLKDRPHDLDEADIAKLAATSDGAVAADLEALVEDAAMAVLSRDGSCITMSDFNGVTASES